MISDPANTVGCKSAHPTGRTHFIDEPLLPLVSVIIVNYNYGRYLEQAIASVFAQTYSRIECVVVDNASTDNSHIVLAAATARYPDLKIVNRSDNSGQSVASIDGLKATHGPYVIFLDADDYLLPRCVETHVQVHLSSRFHAGFTFGDTLQMRGGDMVLSTNAPMATYLLKSPKAAGAVDLLRPTAAGLGSLWPTFDPLLPSRVHLISNEQTEWVWSPTSGNCFRRDALDLFCADIDLSSLRSQTDLYLAVGINSLCGSIMIDEPLFVYRLHGENVFTSRPQLAGMLAYDVNKTANNTHIARALLIEHFIRNTRRFIQDKWQMDVVEGILIRLDVRNPDGATQWQKRSLVATICARHFSQFAAVFGAKRALSFLSNRGAPWTVIWSLRQGNGASEKTAS